MNLFFGFVIGQLMCYISNVKKYTKKKCYPHGQHFPYPSSYKAL